MVVVALLGGICAHVWAQLQWIATDIAMPQGICCALHTHWVDLVRADAQGELGGLLSGFHYQGWMNWIGAVASRVVGASPDALMQIQLGEMVVAQLLMFALVARLGGPVAGVVAALLLPLAPGVAYTMRRWSPFVPQFVVLLAGATCLAWGRGFGRLWSSAAFLALALIGSFMSPMVTDNAFFVASMGALAAGSGLRSLALGRGPLGWPSHRWVVLATTIVVAAVVTKLNAEVYLSRPDTEYLLPYTLRELGLDPGSSWRPMPGHETAVVAQVEDTSSWLAQVAYLRRFYGYELTAWHAVPFLIALPLYLWRGRGRAELLGLLVPLAVLSFVGKKQAFYAYLVLPVVPAITALGLCTFRGRWGRAVSWLLGAVLVGSATWQWTDRSFPGPAPSTRAWEGPAFDQERYLQMPYELVLEPSLADPQRPWRALLEAAPPPDTCPDELLIWVLATEPSWEPIEAELLGYSRCATMVTWPAEVARVPDVVWVDLYNDGTGCVPGPGRWTAAWEALQDHTWRFVGQAEGCRTAWEH